MLAGVIDLYVRGGATIRRIVWCIVRLAGVAMVQGLWLIVDISVSSVLYFFILLISYLFYAVSTLNLSCYE